MKIYIPRHIEIPSVTNVAQTVDQQSVRGGETILVIDDEPALRELCMETLSLQGYQVSGAQDAEQALAILGAAPIDLVLSDIILPGMDGYQLAALVKERYPHVKIQLASGFSDDRQSALLDPVLQAQRLEKPYRLDDLLQRVRQLLDG
jgi:two-component system, cell cycle sensor histidine kinase and response regulator CckA